MSHKTKAKIFCILFYVCGFPTLVTAQIVPDATLPLNSTVTPGGTTFTIEGGTEADHNLFHSFREFSVPTGGTAFFKNADTIQNIFTRVTGGSISNIDGLIRTNSTVNLFLLNPNGIIFGPNASLNIGGSFLGTTANSINFADGTSFSATNPETTPLLTISIPTSLQFGPNPGQIVNQSVAVSAFGDSAQGNEQPVGLEVSPGQILALVGGEVVLPSGLLTAPGGRIELGSVGANSLVSLTFNESRFALGYAGVQNFQDIQLSQAATVNASDIDASGEGGGTIQVQGRRVVLTENSGIISETFGSQDGGTVSIQAAQFIAEGGGYVDTTTYGSGRGGNLSVTATDSIELSGTNPEPSGTNPEPSGFFAQVGVKEGQTLPATGNAGDLTIATGRLILREGAQVGSNTFSEGSGGRLTVTASQSVEVIGRSANGKIPSALVTQAEGGSSGNSQDLTISTRELILREGGEISSSTEGTGNAGNILIQASEQLIIQDRAGVSALTSGNGRGGNISIATERLIAQNGGQVSATSEGSGQAGTLTVNARESVELTGTGIDGFPSGLFTQSTGARARDSDAGNADNLTVTTRQLIVRDGAAISADTFAGGKGGSLTVNASESIEVTGTSGIVPAEVSPFVRADGRLPSRLTAATRGSGEAGSVTINTGLLRVRDGASVAVDGSRGTGLPATWR